MAKEIERKFLVTGHGHRALATARHELAQGYLCADPGRTVRVRRLDGRAFLTVKGPTQGFTRGEWEYEIPAADADEMLALTPPGSLIRKTRYHLLHQGREWVVDEFHGPLEGLVLAEVELPGEDTPVALPPFIGREVTGDPRYYNSQLASASCPP